VISGIDAARSVPRASVYAAGVGGAADSLVTAGGRVLNVVGTGPDVATARATAYQALEHISWPGQHHRTDIAADVRS